MGLSIGAYRVLDLDTWQEGPVTYHEPIEEKVEGWDNRRMAGDGDVPVAADVDWLTPEWDDSGNYHRPADFAIFEAWVTTNIQPHLQPRWLTIIQQMQHDSRIWLYFGW